MLVSIVSILFTLVAVLTALHDIENKLVNITSHVPINMNQSFTRINLTQNVGSDKNFSRLNDFDKLLSSSNDIKNNSHSIKEGNKLVPTYNVKGRRTKQANSTKHNENNMIKNSKKKPKKKRGKVFLDSHEDALQLKLIDNMYFKNIESNNSNSIVFSDESEITEDRIKQAIEDGGGSLAVIPLKRKKDAFRELLRWTHLHDKHERRVKIEKEVFEKYKNKLLKNHTVKASPKKLQLFPPVSVQKMFSKNKTIILKKKTTPDIYSNKRFLIGQKYMNEQTNITVNATQEKKLNNTQFPKPTPNNKYFREQSVEFQFDPDFQNKLYKSVKDQQKEHDKAQKKERQKKKKKRTKEFTFNRPEISDEDYSAQEAFVLNTKKEATGRRYYHVYLNKSASEFWDNNTRETTKMLEVLLPLGEHLHKTLDKVPPNEGKHFMTDLEIYKTQLEKFIALVKKDKPETRPDVVELLEEPYDHVCETKYCEEEIKIMFDWSDEEFKHFEKVYDETREMWFDLQMFHHCYQFVSESAEEPWSLYNCSASDIYSNASNIWNEDAR